MGGEYLTQPAVFLVQVLFGLYATLVAVLQHMNLKDKGYRVIDTHAGAGGYALGGRHAQLRREFDSGIARLWDRNDLPPLVRDFAPGPRRRVGVLVDHLVPGSKETRIAQTVRDPNVLITGHPFVDVWAGIRPKVLGLEAWPDVPRSDVPWKEGLCAALGVPFDGFWPKLRNRVNTFADLRPELVGAVEQLIDFVAE